MDITRSEWLHNKVNRNLVGVGGVGFLSTDQKKKLLWGNKKNNSTEESSSRWDLHLFPDQDRQEKFNRLMGVKGNVASECKPDNNDGSLHAKKQEELDTDLEKQYTAGLRRRDGRTVGLGFAKVKFAAGSSNAQPSPPQTHPLFHLLILQLSIRVKPSKRLRTIDC
ncbi:hypothetical protein MUK42_28134 [Musa troglodytarum]|uniref:Small acidic protein-like domain-containing protein n=1 Tax=Musa troglodytarum TaxID=320322 RepID=A0A9E7JTA6_9LILI|nr:hypothetical protein MUK42_28134 [Musa troglodytarum]